MAFATKRYTGDGATVDFNYPYPYLNQAHVKVKLNDVLTAAYTWLNATTIRFNVAPAIGVAILIYRETSQSGRIVDYTAPSSLGEEDLDNDSLQAFYMAQEALDRAEDALVKLSANLYDAQNTRIVNVANPVNAQDAATKSWVESTTAASAAQAVAAASAALASETNAAASYDSFDDRYLGVKTADPTLDNDGNALVEGAIYFNSTMVPPRFRVRSAGSWIDAVGSNGQYADGSAAAPAITFSLQSNLGFYRISSNTVGASANGNLVWSYSTTGMRMTDGFAGGPTYSFTNSTGMGFYRVANNELGVSCAAANVATFKSTGLELATALAIAQGGTGATSATNAFTNIKQAASDTATGVLEIAVQSEMEAASSNTLAVPPGRMHLHPGVAKFWLKCGVSGNNLASYNITSVTDDGTGLVSIGYTTAMSSANYSTFVSGDNGGGVLIFGHNGPSAGAVQGRCANIAGTLTDPTSWSFGGFGDQ